MSVQNKRSEYGCPVAFGLDVFGDKWSMIVIRDLMFRGFTTFKEFLGAGDGIATNILSNRLKHLEIQGIVKKKRDPENARSYIYSLTEKGRDLVPVMIEIVSWSGKYDDRPNARRGLVEKIRNNRENVEKKVRAGAIDF
ncbi:MAG: helix-turn-helix transcriptional regulator [Rhizobiales bacterium]|nr:helix-turn-helix transcriptional regulator [Hyphomicrobiales bacterium]